MIKGYYLTRSVNYTSSELSWRFYNDGVEWAVPGGMGPGDLSNITDFTFTTTSGGNRRVVIPLDPVVFKNWIAKPQTNNGILLVLQGAATSISVFSCRASEFDRRPQLRVRYGAVANPTCFWHVAHVVLWCFQSDPCPIRLLVRPSRLAHHGRGRCQRHDFAQGHLGCPKVFRRHSCL